MTTDTSDAHLSHALRILARDIYCEDGIATQCLREAADEIDRLQAHVALLEATSAASHSGFMVVAGGFENAVAEISRLRLTDAEREAVRFCGELCHRGERDDLAATLRGLLERTT